MKNIYIFILLLIGIFIQTKTVYSQNFLAFSNDNYAGATGMFYQPASIADSRYKFDMELMGASTRIENNWWGIDSKVIFNPKSIQDTLFIKKYVDVIDNNDPKYISQALEARLLSFMVSLGEKRSIGFSVRARQLINLDNIDPEAADLMLNANDIPELFKKPLDYEDMSVNAVAWVEYGVTYAQVLLNKKKHFLKGGLTVKLLQGMGSAYLYETSLKYELQNDSIAVDIEGDFKFGATANLDDILDFKFAANPAVGLDFGFVYEFRPKFKDYKYKMDGKENLWQRDQNKYLVKVSFSVLDIGQMRFKKQFGSNDFKVSTDELNLNHFNFSTLQELADSTIDMQTSTDPNYNFKLPTTINLNVDLRVVNHIYVNVGGRLALNQGSNSFSRVHYVNSISITPRFEGAFFGASIPVRYNQFGELNVGLGLRLGPLWVGSNNLLAVTGLQKSITTADLYVAIKMPILYHAPKDDDGDFVSNKLDECDQIKGPLEFNGCPDSDGDGIPNKIDDCPYTVGVAAFNGCPDTDGDGVEDKYDDCPDVPGSKFYSGCPDTDGDGIIDMNDSCPNVAGIAFYHGCVDTDGDSIPDNLDDCPNTPGLAKFSGCPDTDNDGIADQLDLCPDVAGLDSLQGCPYTDTDGDSIQDKYDQCPQLAGPLENNGCPYADSDNDSVPDKDDLCPMTPGLVSNNGCPVINEEEVEVLKTAFNNLEFYTGKAKMKPSSFAALKELAELLNKTDYKLLIEGYTDNVGRETANMRLSQNRAKAIEMYLIDHNVKESKLTVKWYGEANPVGDNETEEGRAQNRRVEMKVIFD